jgi:hypothetical protein
MARLWREQASGQAVERRNQLHGVILCGLSSSTWVA